MTPTTLPATLLPRSRGLTEALAAPAGPAPAPEAVAALRRTLRSGLEEVRSGAAAPVRVDGFAVRRACGRAPVTDGGGAEPFRWTPRRARRAVGVPAAARVVGGGA
ncbi:MAG: hypothetical protein ACRDZR_19240, partial [Acidimicrobiales bacterium]